MMIWEDRILRGSFCTRCGAEGGRVVNDPACEENICPVCGAEERRRLVQPDTEHLPDEHLPK